MIVFIIPLGVCAIMAVIAVIVIDIEHRNRMREFNDAFTSPLSYPLNMSGSSGLRITETQHVPVSADPDPLDGEEVDEEADYRKAERRARKLLKSLDSELHRQYCKYKKIKVESARFLGLTYHIEPIDDRMVFAHCYRARRHIGYICIDFEKFNDDYLVALPPADRVLQIAMMIRGGEEDFILANGNWDGDENSCPYQYLYQYFNMEGLHNA